MRAAEHFDTQMALPGNAAGWLAPRHARRAIVIAGFLAAGIAGFAATGAHEASHAVTAAGPDLVRLLRGMAAIKSLMALAATGGVLWRLASPAGPARLAAYAVACAAMASGPGLIWDMAHVGLGALLLHGGLACAVMLLWLDPATSVLLTKAARKKGLRF